MSALSDRLRAVVGGASAFAPDGATARLAPPCNLEAALGGEWRETDGVRCFVVERRVDPSTRYGNQTVGSIAAQLASAAQDAPLVAGGASTSGKASADRPAKPPFMFIDLETTGLSGGAGTYAFLVGCAWCDDEGAFVTRQYMLTRFADERSVLGAVAAEIRPAGAMVSFNGKSFDAPVLETRYLFHRLAWPAEALPHVDVLHPARRFWRDDDVPSCSLCALERQVLGARRVGDVAGIEIPARYFQFIRTGDARPLAPVLEHNRLDLLSLAGLTARILHMVQAGPEASRDAREALALGRIYARGGLDGRARPAFELAASRATGGPLRVEALRSLALGWRRARRFEEAASCWRALLEVAACPPNIAGEAMEALAIHHEHRIRDLEAAKAFALKSLGVGSGAKASLQHRLIRLDRKIEQGSARTLNLEL